MDDQNIGGWSQGDLRRFIVNSVLSDPGSLPKPAPHDPTTDLPGTHSDGDVPVWDKASQRWLPSTQHAIPASGLAGFPNNAAKHLNGVGNWVGGMETLYDIELNSNTNVIDTGASGIPATHTHLLLVYFAKGSGAGTASTVNIRFNGQTAANYIASEFDYTGAPFGPAAHTLATTTMGRVGRMTMLGAPNGAMGIGLVLIPSYLSPGPAKSWMGFSQSNEGNTSATMVGEQDVGCWYDGNAIQQIQLSPDFTGTVNFIAQTRVTIYGLG